MPHSLYKTLVILLSFQLNHLGGALAATIGAVGSLEVRQDGGHEGELAVAATSQKLQSRQKSTCTITINTACAPCG